MLGNSSAPVHSRGSHFSIAPQKHYLDVFLDLHCNTGSITYFAVGDYFLNTERKAQRDKIVSGALISREIFYSLFITM